jgi:hypothetical protein
MGFIKGRAYPIILAMAKDGNEKAKKLLANVDSMAQDEVESMVSEIFGSGSSGESKDWKKDLENKNFNNLAKGESKGDWKSNLEDEEFEQELSKRTGGKYSTKQKFGDFKTAVQSDEDIPEVDQKPFKYKSQGKEKVTVKQSKSFTDDQKNQFNKDYKAGTEVTNDATGETYVTVAAEQEKKPSSFSELKEDEDVEINQGYAFTEQQKDEFDKKYPQGTAITEKFSGDVYFAGGMSKGAQEFISEAYKSKGGRLSKNDLEQIKAETGISDRGLNMFLNNMERGKSQKRARKEINSILKETIERGEYTDQILNQFSDEYAIDVAELKQMKDELIASKKAIPSLNEPTKSSLDENRLPEIVQKNTANENFKARKNEPELSDFPGVETVLNKEENVYKGPAETNFYAVSLDKILSDGGVTVQNGQVIRPEEGYQVAYDKKSEKIFNANEIRRAYNWIKSKDLNNFGIWINRDRNNEIVIDTTSSFVNSEKEALQMAELADQDSVVDWAESKKQGEMVFINKKDYLDRLKKLKGV